MPYIEWFLSIENSCHLHSDSKYILTNMLQGFCNVCPKPSSYVVKSCVLAGMWYIISHHLHVVYHIVCHLHVVYHITSLTCGLSYYHITYMWFIILSHHLHVVYHIITSLACGISYCPITYMWYIILPHHIHVVYHIVHHLHVVYHIVRHLHVVYHIVT